MTPREIRKAAGISAADMAARARICTSYLLRLERNGRAPERMALRLSRLYGCRMELWLRGERAKGN